MEKIIEAINAQIEKITAQQKFEAIEEGGAGIHYTPAYHLNVQEIERLYDELDYLSENTPVVYKDFYIKVVNNSRWVDELYEVHDTKGTFIIGCETEARAISMIDTYTS